VLYTGDGGASWAAGTLTGDVAPDTVACWSTTECIAAGSNAAFTRGVVAKTTDGGATWVHEASPTGSQLLYSIACPSHDRCVTVGGLTGDLPAGKIFFTTDGGSTWT
jgi:photosystem II stability/assembly factor-like uncharacterized protein